MTRDSNITDRQDMEARYLLFENAVLVDQRAYYEHAIEDNQRAASEVNFVRAFFALLAGIVSVFSALIGSNENLRDCIAPPPNVVVECSATEELLVDIVLPLLLITAVAAPALGAAFTTLADLYQWERLTSIYETARRSLASADALSPLPDMPDERYKRSFEAFADGTLRVMRDETAQWGQLIKTPDALRKYVEQATETAQRNTRTFTKPDDDDESST
ncbi:MAG: hypothetical protein OHK0046_13460 [Anaerolineae bacterium]